MRSGRPGVAARLDAAGTVALALMPVAMALANRSSPLVIGIAASLFLAGAVAERGRDALRPILRPLASPLGLAILAFLGWSLVSFAWSPFPDLSARAFAEFALAVLSATLLVRLAPSRMPGWGPPLAAAGLAAACLFIVASLATDLRLQQALGQRAALFMFNRPLLTTVLLAGPLAAVLALRGHRIAVFALVAVSAFAILRSISGAAALGMLAGLGLFVVARFTPKRIGLAIAALMLALAFALAPIEGDILVHFMPEAAHDRLTQSSSRIRVTIAQGFGAAVAEAPILGSGFGTAPRFDAVPAAAALAPEMKRMMMLGHPHNSFLQIWAELGLVGAILGALAAFLALQAAATLPRGLFAVALGLLGAAVAVMFVEHGAWQAWWTAGCGAALAWLRTALTARPVSNE